jgi:Mismatch repair ATPase (MutS family)
LLQSFITFIRENQQGENSQIQGISLFNTNEFMLLDYPTRKNLEILFNINPQQQGNTLLTILDKTTTPMGGRLLKRWVSQPLIKLDEINKRLNIVEYFYNNLELTQEIRQLLGNIGDLERLISKISADKATPRDYVNLKKSLIIAEKIKNLSSQKDDIFYNLIQKIDIPVELVNLLETALVEEPSVTLGIGRVFKKGYNSKVDEYTYLKYSAKEWLQQFQERERQRTQIQSLKVSFNNVFGYYIEISKANISKVPADYERRQTLTNSERYITPELKDFETKTLETESNLLAIEQELLESIRISCIKYFALIQQISQTISELDCYTNLL